MAGLLPTTNHLVTYQVVLANISFNRYHINNIEFDNPLFLIMFKRIIKTNLGKLDPTWVPGKHHMDFAKQVENVPSMTLRLLPYIYSRPITTFFHITCSRSSKSHSNLLTLLIFFSSDKSSCSLPITIFSNNLLTLLKISL